MSTDNRDLNITAVEADHNKVSLYYLEYGEDRDCYVIAKNFDQAVQLWREYFDTEGLRHAMPEYVTLVPIDELLNKTPRALDWQHMQSKGCVLWRG